jgi:ubiquinone/menaquinone biosynthesis C-methylase UbiE
MSSSATTRTAWDASYSDNAAENYQKFFVPVIGGPFAGALVDAAALQPGERVLDVACGTGTIARLAAERVGAAGSVSALDVHGGMLAVARSIPSAHPIKWYETAAESMPLPDESFDVVLCGLSLQFFADKPAALREMRRVLRRGGRVCLSTPVPNAVMNLFDRAVARHISEDASAFVHAVFSLNDPRELNDLVAGAGFSSVMTREHRLTLDLPPTREFIWQYIASTPLMALVPRSGSAQTEALERDMEAAWSPWSSGNGVRYEQSTLIGTAHRA